MWGAGVSIGEKLSQARREKGISIETAEEATKIRARFLEAMESDEFDLLPGRVYAKAFLRLYARYLGLDEGALAAEFDLLYKAEQPPPARPHRLRRRRSMFNWARYRTFLLVLVVIGLLVAFNGVYERIYSGSGEHGRVVQDTQRTGPTNTKPVEMVKDAKPVTGGHNGVQPAEEPQKQKSQGLNLTLTVTGDRCWTRVVADGVVTFEGELRAGEVRSFSARDSILLRLGNAGAVEVSYNGQNVGYLGRLGQPVTREFSARQG